MDWATNCWADEGLVESEGASVALVTSARAGEGEGQGEEAMMRGWMAGFRAVHGLADRPSMAAAVRAGGAVAAAPVRLHRARTRAIGKWVMPALRASLRCQLASRPNDVWPQAPLAPEVVVLGNAHAAQSDETALLSYPQQRSLRRNVTVASWCVSDNAYLFKTAHRNSDDETMGRTRS